MSDFQVTDAGVTASYLELSVVDIEADVFRNLNSGGYSVRSREKSMYGEVVSKEQIVIVRDAEFVVHEEGRQRVLEEGVKNVHAVVRGVVVSMDSWTRMEQKESVPIAYDPYKYEDFVHAETEHAIASADLVCLHPSGVSAFSVTEK